MLRATRLLREPSESATPALPLPELSLSMTLAHVAGESKIPSDPLAVTTVCLIELPRPCTAIPNPHAPVTVTPLTRDCDDERTMPSLKPETLPPWIVTPMIPPWTKMPANVTSGLHVVFEMVWPPMWRTTPLPSMMMPLTASEHTRSPVRRYTPGAERLTTPVRRAHGDRRCRGSTRQQRRRHPDERRDRTYPPRRRSSRTLLHPGNTHDIRHAHPLDRRA